MFRRNNKLGNTVNTADILGQCLAYKERFQVIISTSETRSKILNILKEQNVKWQCLEKNIYSEGQKLSSRALLRKKFIIVEDSSLFTQEADSIKYKFPSFNLTANSELYGDKFENFDLDILLSSTMTGIAIKNIYVKHQKLDSRFQNYLCELIMGHFFGSPLTFRKLQNADFKMISKEIVRLFPNESPLVYYTPPINKQKSKENKSIKAKGKLPDKHRNKLYFLQQCGVLRKEVDEGDDYLNFTLPLNLI